MTVEGAECGLKNTVALYLNHQILMSQHLGDLDNLQTSDRFQEAIHHLLNIYEVQPTVIATDAHPDYYSTQFAHVLIEVFDYPDIYNCSRFD